MTDIITPLGTPVTFKCVKKASENNIGWKAYLSSGERLYGSSQANNLNNLVPLGIDIIYPNLTTSTLHFNATDDRVIAVECLFFDSSIGNTVVSNRISINVVGKLCFIVLQGFIHKFFLQGKLLIRYLYQV